MSEQQVLLALRALQGLKAYRVKQVLQDLRVHREQLALQEIQVQQDRKE